MTTELAVLCTAAASMGFFHTLFGPDHYLPFIVMGRARKWLMWKTAFITFLCGLGHVLSSVVIGAVGIALGISVMKLELFEGVRGSLAAWALIAFGFAYFVWGLHRAVKNRPHRHLHRHGHGEAHEHLHSHNGEHTHVHDGGKANITPWVLFTIFVLGPCEPLIPLLMFPATKIGASGVAIVAFVFSTVTICTMLVITMASAWGVSFARFGRMERYIHALAGATICLSGLAIQFLGL